MNKLDDSIEPLAHPVDVRAITTQLHVAFLVTSPLSLKLLRGPVGYLAASGYKVTVICGPGPEVAKFPRNDLVCLRTVSMDREISPGRDLVSLWRLICVLRECSPDIINFSTPKASLLGAIAGTLLRIPVRIYTLRGLRCETADGLKRQILIACERITCALSHKVICVSPSLRNCADELGIVGSRKSEVIGAGSSNGVHWDKFTPSEVRLEAARKIREGLSIPDRAPVVGFVGRLTRDKGITELVEAYHSLRQSFPELCLLLVGDFEAGDPIPDTTREAIEGDCQIIRTGFVGDVSSYYHVMTALALPTYREGFPNVPLEAQAAGIPVVTTDATGAVDSVLHERTGIIVPMKNADALAHALRKLIDDPGLRNQMGIAGQNWVARAFRPETIWESMQETYLQALESYAKALSTSSGFKLNNPL